MISTQRFRRRPSALSLPSGYILAAMGFASPQPFVVTRLPSPPPVLDQPRFHGCRALLRQPEVVDLLPFRIRMACNRHFGSGVSLDDLRHLPQRGLRIASDVPFVEIEQDITGQLDADFGGRFPDCQRLRRPFDPSTGNIRSRAGNTSSSGGGCGRVSAACRPHYAAIEAQISNTRTTCSRLE